jgi:hypothetical protein
MVQVRPAGWPAHCAAAGQRQPGCEGSDRQLCPHPHGCDPSVPAAAGRPHKKSTTRPGCAPAAIRLRSGATRRYSGFAHSDRAGEGTAANTRTHPRLAHQHAGNRRPIRQREQRRVLQLNGPVAGLPGRPAKTPALRTPIGEQPGCGSSPGAPNRTWARPSNDAQRVPALWAPPLSSGEARAKCRQTVVRQITYIPHSPQKVPGEGARTRHDRRESGSHTARVASTASDDGARSDQARLPARPPALRHRQPVVSVLVSPQSATVRWWSPDPVRTGPDADGRG